MARTRRARMIHWVSRIRRTRRRAISSRKRMDENETRFTLRRLKRWMRTGMAAAAMPTRKAAFRNENGMG
jgi:hypothetical protein